MDGSRIRINIRRRSISSKRSKTTLQQLKQQKLYSIIIIKSSKLFYIYIKPSICD